MARCALGPGAYSFFFEKNIHAFFLRILNQKTNSTITVQLLQTLSILFENIKTETSICTWLDASPSIPTSRTLAPGRRVREAPPLMRPRQMLGSHALSTRAQTTCCPTTT